MVRVTIESESQKELTDWALRYLADLGYVVSHSQTLPETPQQLATRLGVSTEGLGVSQRKEWACGNLGRGPGRLISAKRSRQTKTYT